VQPPREFKPALEASQSKPRRQEREHSSRKSEDSCLSEPTDPGHLRDVERLVTNGRYTFRSITDSALPDDHVRSSGSTSSDRRAARRITTGRLRARHLAVGRGCRLSREVGGEESRAGALVPASPRSRRVPSPMGERHTASLETRSPSLGRTVASLDTEAVRPSSIFKEPAGQGRATTAPLPDVPARPPRGSRRQTFIRFPGPERRGRAGRRLAERSFGSLDA